MDSYKDTFVRIWNQGEAFNPIPIRKGVKQGCQLSPLLFNICIDPIFNFIMRQLNHKFAYQTEQFSYNLIQAYVDDTPLISNSAEGLQKLIDDADTFFKFVNIKLNPRKCKIFRTNSKTNQVTKIVNIEKEYVSELEYIKYLMIPLGSKRIGKIKFAEAKIQKMLYEIGRLEFSGLAINQMLKVIRIMILTQLNY
jgi:hypothetical protein